VTSHNGFWPNPHKALGVKRKYFPRPRGRQAFFLTPFSPGCSSGAEATSPRPGLLSVADAAPGPTGHRRAAPNTHADSGGPTPQSRAAVPGTVSRPVPILIRSRLRGQSKTTGSPPQGEGPVRQGSRAGRVVRRAFLLLRGAVAGVGETWEGASAPSPYYLRQPRADLVSPPTHRRGAVR
jgi:hypothetical protein